VETDADKRELASPSRGVSNAAPASHAAPDIDEMKLELKKIRSTQSERKTELENLHKKKDVVEEKFILLTVNAKKIKTEFKHIRGELEKKRTEHSAVLGLVRKLTQLCDEDSRKALELESGIAKFAQAKKQEELKIAQAALDATQAEGKLLVAAQVHLAEIRRQHNEDEVLPTTTQAFLAARGCLSTEVQARLGNLSQPPSMREIKKMFEALEKEKARVEAVEQKALSALQQGSNSGSDLDNIVKEIFKVLPDLVVVGIERHEAQTKTSLD
jgi:chromosome segregation ATPase